MMIRQMGCISHTTKIPNLVSEDDGYMLESTQRSTYISGCITLSTEPFPSINFIGNSCFTFMKCIELRSCHYGLFNVGYTIK